MTYDPSALAFILDRADELPNGCIVWHNCVNSSGYGLVNEATKVAMRLGTRKAHRIAYIAEHGPTNEPIVRHTCDTPLCVNPAHLIAGTWQDNMNDMLARGRHVSLGRKMKLTDAQAAEIFHRRGEKPHVLAVEFGVNPSTIRRYILREKAKRKLV